MSDSSSEADIWWQQSSEQIKQKYHDFDFSDNFFSATQELAIELDILYQEILESNLRPLGEDDSSKSVFAALDKLDTEKKDNPSIQLLDSGELNSLIKDLSVIFVSLTFEHVIQNPPGRITHILHKNLDELKETLISIVSDDAYAQQIINSLNLVQLTELNLSKRDIIAINYIDQVIWLDKNKNGLLILLILSNLVQLLAAQLFHFLVPTGLLDNIFQNSSEFVIEAIAQKIIGFALTIVIAYYFCSLSIEQKIVYSIVFSRRKNSKKCSRKELKEALEKINQSLPNEINSLVKNDHIYKTTVSKTTFLGRNWKKIFPRHLPSLNTSQFIAYLIIAYPNGTLSFSKKAIDQVQVFTELSKAQKQLKTTLKSLIVSGEIGGNKKSYIIKRELLSLK